MIALLLLVLFLPIILAPMETAGWWSRRRVSRTNEPELSKAPGAPPEIQLVYFTGVAGYSGDFLARRERALLDSIAEQFPGMRVHHEIFPYSSSNVHSTIRSK